MLARMRRKREYAAIMSLSGLSPRLPFPFPNWLR